MSALSILTSARQYITAGLVGLGAFLALLVVLASVYVQIYAQNQGAPAPVQPLTFFDANGDPLNAGTVSTYVTATGTSAVTYSDQALNTRNANPVVLNSAGRASIFLAATQVYRFIVADSSNAIQFTQDGLAGANYIAEQQALELSCGGRITGSSGVPVTTADANTITTLYFTPAVSNRCAARDSNGAWRHYTFSELSLALGTDAIGMYDLFVYASNGGTLALERLAWANIRDRTTNLTYQDGVLVKSGDATRRYLGSYYVNAIGQTQDAVSQRFISNEYNRVMRRMLAVENTNSWVYTTNTYRAANGTTTNALAFVSGTTRMVSGEVNAHVSNTGNVNVYVSIGDGDSQTQMDEVLGQNTGTFIANATAAPRATISQYARVGYHTWIWLEKSAASGTTTWYGDNGSTAEMQSGIWGWLEQ